MSTKGLWTCATSHWSAPAELYESLDMEFGFTLDPCPLGAISGGLDLDWTGVVYVNPPYGRDVGKWVRKGWESSQLGAIVVMLLPSRTDTRWFHDYCVKGEIRFLKGRLRFGDATNSAPFPSMIVVFR